MRIGWWHIICTLDGSPADLNALSQDTRNHIAELIKGGYHAGEIIEENEEEEE